MTLFVACFRSTKSDAKVAISAHAVQMQTTPFRQLLTPYSESLPVSSPCWTPGTTQATTCLRSDSTESLSAYNKAMDEIASKVAVQRKPLTSQLDSWDRSTVEKRQYYIQKATEDCMVVCQGIAPNDGKQLFEAVRSADLEKTDPIADDLVKTLMHAYKEATNRSTKTQILSLYAYKYSVSTLKKLHLPYGKLSTRQIHRARCHVRSLGPGSVPEQKIHYRVRIDMSKVDHFIEFINRPYFYQDVSFGTKLLKLDSGEIIEMPNVVRTVTRSTMISQYIQFCQEEKSEPLSRSTLFKILEVREASQRKSLQGLDNTAADGSAVFQTVEKIVDDLEKGGLARQWCTEVKGKLKDAKRYLKTGYSIHCKSQTSACPDHCRKFALSDEHDTDFQESCSHQHSETCEDCRNLRNVLDEVENQISGSSWSPYSNEQRDDLIYDLMQARTDILHWKAHILRSINQEAAKQDQLEIITNNPNYALIVMDWAMKFLQLRYREKQSDWYGKRGLSWHISTVISSDPNKPGSLELQSYAHLFDTCQQDWFAVCSIIESTLETIKTQKPHITQVYLRSDEAGCYHNNSLISAAKDIGQRVGITVCRYDYSEPQYGKDVCDRILCPMKTCIRRYCNEGHDILTAADMKRALSERPVKGTSACVCVVDMTKKTLHVNKIEGFSKLHNVQFEEKGIRVWRSYGVGRGKEVPFDELVSRSQENTGLVVNEEFFACRDTRVYKCKNTPAESSVSSDSEIDMFECSEPGCYKSFQTFSELESHLDIGDHHVREESQSETLYDKLRRDWVDMFSTSVNITKTTKDATSTPDYQQSVSASPLLDQAVNIGWALPKPRTGSSKFSEKVKNYLTARFDLGEQTGRKADPQQVSNDMRKATDEQNNRLFDRKEWLTKSQVQGFFSRLAATRRRQQDPTEVDLNSRDLLREEEEADRQYLIEEVTQELRPRHPLSYDAFNLCDCAKENKLCQFNVPMLKQILRHFEIPFKSRDKKRDLIEQLVSFLQECDCRS